MKYAVAAIAGLFGSLLVLTGSAGAATVAIDGSQTYQTIDGFGVNANHRSWNGKELQPVLDALIDQAGMTLFHVIFDNNNWEAVNDNSDPNVMNWAYYNTIYSAPDFQKLWGIMAYLNQRGITSGCVPELQGPVALWMGGLSLTPGYEAEYAETIASLLIYARNTQHLQFDAVGPINEPDNTYAGIHLTGAAQYVTTMHALGQQLDANGLSDVRFSGPDLAYTHISWLGAMMGDAYLMSKVARFGLHSYRDLSTDSTGVYDFIQQSAYPDHHFWMTEFNVQCNSCATGGGGDGSWAYARGAASWLLNHLANGASAGLVWEGYDSQYTDWDPATGGNSPVHWSYWGLLAVDDINATARTYTPRKQFYTLSQISKFVRPGARRINVTGLPASLTLLGFHQPATGQITLTGVNSGSSAADLSGTLASLPAVGALELYYTDSGTNLCDGGAVSVTNGGFAVTVPADCVFTLVGSTSAVTTVSVVLTSPVDGAIYTAPASIPIRTSPSTASGTITGVSFFNGMTNLGQLVAEPYSITWSNVPPGTYELTASATNSSGDSAVSPAVHVTVATAGAATVIIDGAQTYQMIEGFGANINHRSWNNNELQPVLDALIDQGGMTLFRVIFDNADWEAANDNQDPSVMNWVYYNQVYSTPDFRKLWGISAYLNQRGITNGLMFNFQGVGPGWMGGGTLTPGYEAEWAEMVASAFIYARKTQHLQFTLVGPDNEEDISTQGVDMTSIQYVTALHTLAQLLDANGLGDLRFVGPDLGYTSTAWLSAMMNDPVIMAKLAHFGFHSYQDAGGGSTGIYNFLQQSAYRDRTIWMTEFNVWCDSCAGKGGAGDSWAYASGAARYLLHHLANGASAGLVWEGYDSQYKYYTFPGGWSYWGLFGVNDINAASKTYTARKLFYTLSQISKFVRPGARRISVSGVPASLTLLGFHQPATGQITLTGVNTDSSTVDLSGTLASLPAVGSLELYYTDSTTNLCDSGAVPVTNGGFAVTVPADCVFTLVGSTSAVTTVSVVLTSPVDGAYYSAPASIPIRASTSTASGTITSVSFFNGTTHLGQVVAEPYSITWSNVPPGTYELTASPTSSSGGSAVSPAVHITVVTSPVSLRSRPVPAVLTALLTVVASTMMPSNSTVSYSAVSANVAGLGKSMVATPAVGLPPHFTSVTLLRDRNPLLTFDGVSNLAYRIDASTDLLSWTTLTNMAGPSGTLHFIDPDAPGFSKRFYRAVWAP